MENSILFNSNDKKIEKIQMILRQTTYSEEEARDKLEKNNYDHIKVVRTYLGLTEKKKPTVNNSLNQEIYKQIRSQLDSNMREYNIRKENGEGKI